MCVHLCYKMLRCRIFPLCICGICETGFIDPSLKTRVVMMPTLPSLVAPEVAVKSMFAFMTTVGFRWWYSDNPLYYHHASVNNIFVARLLFYVDIACGLKLAYKQTTPMWYIAIHGFILYKIQQWHCVYTGHPHWCGMQRLHWHTIVYTLNAGVRITPCWPPFQSGATLYRHFTLLFIYYRHVSNIRRTKS